MDIDLIMDDPELAVTMAVLCADRNGFKRERRRAARHLVSEIYSPPRVTKMLSSMPNHFLAPGFALDLTCTDPADGLPLDFDNPIKRARAHRLLRAQTPLVLIGSPMCTAWATW